MAWWASDYIVTIQRPFLWSRLQWQVLCFAALFHSGLQQWDPTSGLLVADSADSAASYSVPTTTLQTSAAAAALWLGEREYGSFWRLWTRGLCFNENTLIYFQKKMSSIHLQSLQRWARQAGRKSTNGGRSTRKGGSASCQGSRISVVLFILFNFSSDSDSDQEELPHSQRHQKQKQVSTVTQS